MGESWVIRPYLIYYYDATSVFETRIDFFAGMVFISLIIGCLFQDFIETQAGVTIFALFYSLALYREEKEINHPEVHL